MAVSDQDLETLRSWIRSSSLEAGLAERARIVTLAAEGLANTEIAERLGITRPTVILWRGRYELGGIDALADRPRSGRPREIDEDRRLDIVARILPIRPGLPERATHDYVRHGTATLFAALEVATGG